jgi:hypothetical protein
VPESATRRSMSPLLRRADSRHALRRHLEGDLPAVMSTITEAMSSHVQGGNLGLQEERLREAEAACRCAESWVDYGLGAE